VTVLYRHGYLQVQRYLQPLRAARQWFAFVLPLRGPA
jgi:hypothetical protein